MLNDLYFKTTCNIRPHFLGPMGGLKIEGPLYVCFCGCISSKPTIMFILDSFFLEEEKLFIVPIAKTRNFMVS